jgi:hypothetical protein
MASPKTLPTLVRLLKKTILSLNLMSHDDRGRIKTNSLDTTRDQSLAIKTALQFKIPLMLYIILGERDARL